jgi:hypothetical protein
MLDELLGAFDQLILLQNDLTLLLKLCNDFIETQALQLLCN